MPCEGSPYYLHLTDIFKKGLSVRLNLILLWIQLFFFSFYFTWPRKEFIKSLVGREYSEKLWFSYVIHTSRCKKWNLLIYFHADFKQWHSQGDVTGDSANLVPAFFVPLPCKGKGCSLWEDLKRLSLMKAMKFIILNSFFSGHCIRDVWVAIAFFLNEKK